MLYSASPDQFCMNYLVAVWPTVVGAHCLSFCTVSADRIFSCSGKLSRFLVFFKIKPNMWDVITKMREKTLNEGELQDY